MPRVTADAGGIAVTGGNQAIRLYSIETGTETDTTIGVDRALAAINSFQQVPQPSPILLPNLSGTPGY